MFSPSLAMSGVRRFAIGPFGSFSHASVAESPALAMSASTSFISCWKSGVRATKSDSQLTSARIPEEPSAATVLAISPSLAIRPAFFAALARPRLRRIVFASSKSPFASLSAFLHSIMPAPVWSRSFFTMSAVIAVVAIAVSPEPKKTPAPIRGRRLSGELLRGLRGSRGRFAARPLRPPGPARIRFLRGGVLGRFAGVLGVDRLLHVAAGDHRVGDPRREQPDRAQRVVVAGNDQVDFVGIAVGVDDANHRNLQLARLVDGNLFLLGVDHEHRVGQPRHAADAFEVLRQLAAFLLVAGDFLLREGVEPTVGGHRFEI